MDRIPRAMYTRELREEAVKMVTEGGLTINEVGRRLSISPSTIRYWINAKNESAHSTVGKHARPVTEEEMEISRLKRKITELEMERDILKNRPKDVCLSL
jgi:transposase-like protein